MSFSQNNEYGYEGQSEIQRSVDRIKADIRLRFHENYFRKQRSIIANQQKLQYRSNNFYSEPQARIDRNTSLNSEYMREKQENNYSICLNSKQQLFPEPIQLPTHEYINTNTVNEQETQIPDLNKIETFTNIYNLSKLYNLIHSGYYNSMPHLIIVLVQKTLQEIEYRLITMYQIYFNIRQFNQVNSSAIQTYEQCQKIAFLLLIIYKTIENIIKEFQDQNQPTYSVQGQSNELQHLFYRRKLIELCDKYKVLDVKMMGALGIRVLRSIEY